jgi:glycosyltransferase involved in cell wall biosynthesis
MISVIIPNYNHSRFLQQRIESVLNQTYKDLECIILDDCSTDNSKDVIELYRNNPKVSHIEYNNVNSGSVFKQWENGVSLAKGDYIWIAESDDWAELSFLEKTHTKFQEDSEIGLVYSNSNMFIDDKLTTTLSEVKINILKNSKWTSDYINDGSFEIIDSLMLCCSINNASAVLFKKAVLINASPFDLDFKYFGDWYCYLKIASISKIAYINMPLNNYRSHADNISKKAPLSFNHLNEYFLIYDWIFKKVQIKNKRQVMSYFYGFTKHNLALFNPYLRKQYIKLYKINRKLFFQMILFNIWVNIISILKKCNQKGAAWLKKY